MSFPRNNAEFYRIHAAPGWTAAPQRIAESPGHDNAAFRVEWHDILRGATLAEHVGPCQWCQQ